MTGFSFKSSISSHKNNNTSYCYLTASGKEMDILRIQNLEFFFFCKLTDVFCSSINFNLLSVGQLVDN